MPDRICTACGASNPRTATFCGTCDAYVDWADTVTGTEPPDPVQVAADRTGPAFPRGGEDAPG